MISFILIFYPEIGIPFLKCFFLPRNLKSFLKSFLRCFFYPEIGNPFLKFFFLPRNRNSFDNFSRRLVMNNSIRIPLETFVRFFWLIANNNRIYNIELSMSHDIQRVWRVQLVRIFTGNVQRKNHRKLITSDFRQKKFICKHKIRSYKKIKK